MEEKQTKKEEEEFDSYTYRFYDASKIYMAADYIKNNLCKLYD